MGYYPSLSELFKQNQAFKHNNNWKVTVFSHRENPHKLFQLATDATEKFDIFIEQRQSSSRLYTNVIDNVPPVLKFLLDPNNATIDSLHFAVNKCMLYRVLKVCFPDDVIEREEDG